MKTHVDYSRCVPHRIGISQEQQSAGVGIYTRDIKSWKNAGKDNMSTGVHNTGGWDGTLRDTWRELA